MGTKLGGQNSCSPLPCSAPLLPLQYLWWITDECIYDDADETGRHMHFGHAFWFSVQTASTIGGCAAVPRLSSSFKASGTHWGGDAATGRQGEG